MIYAVLNQVSCTDWVPTETPFFLTTNPRAQAFGWWLDNDPQNSNWWWMQIGPSREQHCSCPPARWSSLPRRPPLLPAIARVSNQLVG